MGDSGCLGLLARGQLLQECRTGTFPAAWQMGRQQKERSPLEHDDGSNILHETELLKAENEKETSWVRLRFLLLLLPLWEDTLYLLCPACMLSHLCVYISSPVKARCEGGLCLLQEFDQEEARSAMVFGRWHQPSPHLTLPCCTSSALETRRGIPLCVHTFVLLEQCWWGIVSVCSTTHDQVESSSFPCLVAGQFLHQPVILLLQEVLPPTTDPVVLLKFTSPHLA